MNDGSIEQMSCAACRAVVLMFKDRVLNNIVDLFKVHYST